jgi:hypothetical protein
VNILYFPKSHSQPFADEELKDLARQGSAVLEFLLILIFKCKGKEQFPLE